MTMPVASWLKLVSSRAFCSAGEREHGQHHADERALAAEDGHPAEQHDRDHVQLKAEAVVLHRGGQPERDSTPASAQTRPDSTYSMVLTRLTRMPANSAASGLAPIA